jgi:hypothetical protein
MGKLMLKSPFPKHAYTVGVDLGQSIDPTAICVLERRVVPAAEEDWGRLREVETKSGYRVRFLERLPLGTSYPQQVQHVADLLARPPLSSPNFRKTQLVIDQTGCGRPVFDMFVKAGLRPHGITITAGREVTSYGREWHVPKLELVSRLQAAFHSETLKIAEGLADAATLAKELQDFRASFTSAGNVIFNAREGAHDDLVLATAIALWYAVEHEAPTSRQEFVSIYA